MLLGIFCFTVASDRLPAIAAGDSVRNGRRTSNAASASAAGGGGEGEGEGGGGEGGVAPSSGKLTNLMATDADLIGRIAWQV